MSQERIKDMKGNGEGRKGSEEERMENVEEMGENGEERKEKEEREEKINIWNNPLPLAHKRPE